LIYYGKGLTIDFEKGYSLENKIDENYELTGIKSFPLLFSYPEQAFNN
jgi:hypothetical protein